MMATAESEAEDQKKSIIRSIMDNVKKHGGMVCQAGLLICQGFLSDLSLLVQTYGDLDTFRDMITDAASPQALNAFFSDSFESMNHDSCSNIRNVLTSGQAECLTQADKAFMLTEIDKVKKELFKGFIIVELLTSATVIVTQSANLIITWKELAVANNVLFESEEVKKTIHEEVCQLEQETDQLRETMQYFAKKQLINWLPSKKDEHTNDPVVSKEALKKYKDNNNSEQLGEESRKFIIKISRLSRKKGQIQNSLGKVQLKINDSIVSLRVRRSTHISDGLIDAAYLIANIYELFTAAANPFNVLKGIKYCITASFGLFFVSNVVTVTITSRKLKQLREQMEETEKLTDILDVAEKNIEILEEWILQIDAFQAKCRGMESPKPVIGQGKSNDCTAL